MKRIIYAKLSFACGAFVRSCIPAFVPDIMLRRALREFLKHSTESRVALGQEREGAQKRAQKRAEERAPGKQESKQAGKEEASR